MDVSVIIPTLANSTRADTLMRALQSLEGQERCRVRPIVVVNGNRSDTQVLERLASLDLTLLKLPDASLPGALSAGRAAVQTEFFGFLDDDDEYLPDAIDVRLQNIDGYDVVATGGYEVWDGERIRVLEDMEEYRADPLLSFFRRGNWLASCGALFRTSSVPVEMFSDLPRYFEWTYFAAKLCCAGKRINMISAPTFLINKGSVGSLSLSLDSVLTRPKVLRQMLHLPLPTHVRTVLERNRSDALHLASEAQRSNGRLGSAWYFHLRSLYSWYGIRYLPYTRYLIKDAVRRRQPMRATSN